MRGTPSAPADNKNGVSGTGGGKIEATLTVDGDQTIFVWEERGLPARLLAPYGAGIQAQVEDLGAYLAVLGGCDGIVFGGGVGEHMPEIRERILASLGWAGVELDRAANAAARGEDARISAPGSRTHVHVIPVDEEHVLAAAALECIQSTA